MKRYMVMDAHCDTASLLLDRNENLQKNTCHISLGHLTAFKSYIQFFAAWVKKEEPEPFGRAMHLLLNVKKEIAKYPDAVCEIRTAGEAEQVLHDGKIGIILSMEDGRSLCGSLENLHRFYDLGVRALCLAWNDNNDLTDGAFSAHGNGLTDFGKKVVAEMNRLHMMVDVSHITEKGFFDVVEISEFPFMASHANCKSLCDHQRNLSDEQIRLMIERKCFIGIDLYRPHLSDDGQADIGTVLKHMNHILELGGEDILGLGSDFDGMEQLPEGICHVGDYIKLFDEMRKNGYSDVLIDKITHKNMLDFIKSIEK